MGELSPKEKAICSFSRSNYKSLILYIIWKKGGCMAGPIVTMKRYEVKYILTAEQHDFLVEALKGHMEVDQYGLTSIASIYYDTPDYRLIRTSIEKPPFKEKIRLRSYGLSKPGGTVFLELKEELSLPKKPLIDSSIMKVTSPLTDKSLEKYLISVITITD